MMGRLLASSCEWKSRALARVACAVLCATPLGAQPSSTLTPKEIDQAVEWGMHDDPVPYRLHHVGHLGSVNPVMVGAIYTPYLRVALAAKAARTAGRTFAPSDIPPHLVEPVVYVAFRWYCCVDPDHGRDLATWDPFTPPMDYKVGVPGDRLLRANPKLRVTAAPLWVTRDLSLLASFSSDLPYRDVVLIAGYPMNVLSTSPDFVIYREWLSGTFLTGTTKSILVGRVTPDDLKRWR